jgi:flavin reductase (DIM6/NTAB) family NADH-FMN oxidoreductase RutF
MQATLPSLRSSSAGEVPARDREGRTHANGKMHANGETIMRTDRPVISRDRFRSIMRRLASSVTVITMSHGDHVHGMTATAVCSVSADPPTILIVVNRSTRSHPLIDSSGFFVVNILAESQRALAERFAGKSADQFAGVDYRLGDTIGPVLQDAAAHLECRVVGQSDVGSHTVFIGEVIGGGASGALPLLYHNGRYARLAQLNPDELRRAP